MKAPSESNVMRSADASTAPEVLIRPDAAPVIMANAEVKNLSASSEVRRFEHGKVELVTLGGATVGRFVLQKGWKWSKDVKPVVKTEWCEAPHFQYVISGRYHVKMKDGTEFDIGPGDAAAVPPGHDAWVLGDEPTGGHRVRRSEDCHRRAEESLGALSESELSHPVEEPLREGDLVGVPPLLDVHDASLRERGDQRVKSASANRIDAAITRPRSAVEATVQVAMEGLRDSGPTAIPLSTKRCQGNSNFRWLLFVTSLAIELPPKLTV